MELGLTDRVCVVTGSTAGIGLETARLLVEEGARVVVSGRDPERVEAARSDAGAALGVPGDLSTPEAPGELIVRAETELGQVDCLVNNVGLAVQASFDELTDDDWEAMWQLNVMSYVRAIQAALPGMRGRGSGRIVNVSSTAGKRPSTSMPDYSVTKAAVLSLSRLVADVYAADGILCNAVTPGPTASPAWLRRGGPRRSGGEALGQEQGGGSRRRRQGSPARAPGRARGDRRGDRLLVLGPCQLRHGVRMERRRGHGSHHHLGGSDEMQTGQHSANPS